MNLSNFNEYPENFFILFSQITPINILYNFLDLDGKYFQLEFESITLLVMLIVQITPRLLNFNIYYYYIIYPHFFKIISEYLFLIYFRF